jgi:hypothetical protein
VLPHTPNDLLISGEPKSNNGKSLKIRLLVAAAQIAPGLCSMSPSKCRGRRECRMLTAPMARLQQGKQAAATTGSAGTTGIPCAMVLTAAP